MHTSSYADVADLFAEKIIEHEGKTFYEYDGKLSPVKSKPLVIRYKKGDSVLKYVLTAYSTIHGPVLGKKDGKWLALKENNRSLDALMQSWLRTKAKDFEDFKRVMNLRANNSNNTVFADSKGNIAYWHGNFMPRRDVKFDYSYIVDGSISGTNWKGLHALDEIVHVYNPTTGWIQNCNSTPFTSAGSNSPKKEAYPIYMAPDGENFRAINAARLLSQHKNLTIERMIDSIGYNRYLSMFDYLIQALGGAYNELTSADTLRMRLEEPVQLLKNWDKTSSASSIATTIALEWGYRVLQKALPPATPYKVSDALSQLFFTLGNLSSKELLKLMIDTQDDLQKRFGTWKVAWGEVNRFQRINSRFDDALPSIPVGLAAGTFGSLPSYASRRFGTDRRYGVSGNSFIACVEFGKKVKAKSIIIGGQSFDPGSKHFTDQAQMYIDGKFKDVLFYKEDVLKHVEREYHPGE
jgi:acyl-homoserine-lactone acylase